jgi:lipoprotein-anchoring transpeptidase ErfK/SrfK
MQTTIKIRKQLHKAALLLSALVIASTAALAQQTPSADGAATSTVPVRRIIVSVPDRKLALVEDGVVKAVFPVAVGKERTPSPSGSFRIVNRVSNPTYYHEGKVIPPGPANPVGTRWMGLSDRGYGIHGTNVPGSIGKAASHGCIRMAKRDLERLFAMVRVGDEVEIRSQRDEETEQLFGAEERTELADASVGRHSDAN